MRDVSESGLASVIRYRWGNGSYSIGPVKMSVYLMTEADSASEASCILNIPKTMDSTQDNIYVHVYIIAKVRLSHPVSPKRRTVEHIG
jgi:hypothetical protein